MKTGRLLKFHRPAGDVHAYLYREKETMRASLFLLGGAPGAGEQPLAVLEGGSEDEVETRVRAWIDEHYPR